MKLKLSPELCAFEFFDHENFKRFVGVNPQMANTMTLRAGNNFLLVFQTADFPTREIQELFDHSGKSIGKFIGPDALKWTYQIRLAQPGEQGGSHPEAFH